MIKYAKKNYIYYCLIVTSFEVALYIHRKKSQEKIQGILFAKIRESKGILRSFSSGCRCTKNVFQFRIYSVNITKSAGNCRFGHIY